METRVGRSLAAVAATAANVPQAAGPESAELRAYNAAAVRRHSDRSDRVSRLASVAAITGGLLTHIGWQFDLPVLRQPMADAASMVPTTATTLIVVGVSLRLLSMNRLPRMTVLLGALVGAVGLLSLGHVWFGPDFTVDQLWLADTSEVSRMSPFTALCFTFLGAALIASTRERFAWTAQVLALMAMLVATVVSMGYLYRVSNLVGIGLYTTMAPHTAALVLVVSIGILFVRPREGAMAVIFADTLGGTMARRTLPFTIGIPIALGWLRLAGERAGLYDPKVGPPLIVIGSIVLLSIVIWLNAKLLAEVDAKRNAAEDRLRRWNEELEASVAQKTAEIRAAEEQLRTGQRLEALGHLAGGVAHDFNNMMTVVSGYSELLLGQIPAEHPFRKALLEIKKAGDRCANLTGHLLAFSRRQVMAPVVLDLNAVVADLSNMLPVLLGERISVAIETDPDLWHVRADPAQIEQAIVNLVVNARDAMPGGGTLTMTTRNTRVDRPADPNHPEIAPGSYVQLCIADTGHGMDAETKFHAFDPFFTTKPVGQGTGLGLSTAYGVIRQSDGHIVLDSAPGSGATFRIYLPRIEAPLTAAPVPAETRLTSGRETVLLVEDEEALRLFVKVLLESAGYTVLDAPGGEQALTRDQQHAEPIHLLLTDVVMAGMSGGELAGRFRERRPDAAVLLMSGHAQNVVVHHTMNTTGAMFIQKPFSPESLLARVREVLDGARGPASYNTQGFLVR